MAGTALLALTRCGGGGLPSAREGRPVRRGTTRLGGAGLLAPSNTPPPPRGRSIAQRGTGAGRSPGAAGAACRHEGGRAGRGEGPRVRFCTVFSTLRQIHASRGAKSGQSGRRAAWRAPAIRQNAVVDDTPCRKVEKTVQNRGPPPREPAQRRAGGRRRTPPAESGPDPPRAPDPPSGARPLLYSASPNRPQVNRKSSDLGEPPTCARMSPWARRSTAKADPGSAGASRMAA